MMVASLSGHPPGILRELSRLACKCGHSAATTAFSLTLTENPIIFQSVDCVILAGEEKSTA